MRKKVTTRKPVGRKRGKVLGSKPTRKKSRKVIRIPGPAVNVEVTSVRSQWLGPRTAGQSGDIQGLRALEESGPESVIELAEEGQDFEAELISGVESAPDADQGEIKPRRQRGSTFLPETVESE
jgi:hypothetical protein